MFMTSCKIIPFLVSSDGHKVLLQFAMSACRLLRRSFSYKGKEMITLKLR